MGDNFNSTKENVCPKLFYNYHLHMESRTGHVVSPYTHYLNNMFCLQIIQPISTILYICIFKIRSESDLHRVTETKVLELLPEFILLFFFRFEMGGGVVINTMYVPKINKLF